MTIIETFERGSVLRNKASRAVRLDSSWVVSQFEFLFGGVAALSATLRQNSFTLARSRSRSPALIVPSRSKVANAWSRFSKRPMAYRCGQQGLLLGGAR